MRISDWSSDVCSSDLDQGGAIVQFRLPPGATQPRSLEVQKTIEKYLLQDEAANTSHVFTVSGIGGGGSPGGQNTGLGFVSLKSWDQRPGKENSADAITGRLQAALAALRDAPVFALVPPAVRGLGPASGVPPDPHNSGGRSGEDL